MAPLPSDLQHRPLDLADRLWAAAQLATVLAITGTSSIRLSVWWFDGGPALAMTVVFAALLISIICRPGHSWQYVATGIVGALWFAGRGLAFGELALDGSSNLTGSAVSAGVGQAVTHGSLCLISIYRVVFRREQAAGDRAARYRRSQLKSSPRGEGDERE